MSENQYVAFRAIDGPVSKENLEYMRKQSSRAEITPWSFDNEYHYGDFRVVEQRTREAYRQIGQLLAELRESLAGTDQSRLAEQQAQKLKKENPTLRLLISELHRERFLAK